jgi:hypothetical protein
MPDGAANDSRYFYFTEDDKQVAIPVEEKREYVS